jgi:hypothetical protein
MIGTLGCARKIENCTFNPGVTLESKSKPKDGETQNTESKIEERLPVKVSPKGEVTCSF